MEPSEITFSIPDEIAKVSNTLKNKGFEAYLVGGCVRDLIIGIKPKDWDITTNAKPEEIISCFPKTFYENEYGTVGVVNEGVSDETLKVVEVTPYRIESEYSNRRHPDSVKFSSKLEDDLKRRDFTINAIALQIGEPKGHNKYKGHLVDLYGGREDIRSGLIQTVGSANERLSEDALRIMRAIRIATELGFTINVDTERVIIEKMALLKEVSAERVREELNRILASEQPSLGFELLRKYGVLEIVIPEFVAGIGMKQNSAHSYDVWEHSLKALQHSAKKKLSLQTRLAVLFHDIGKITTRRWSDDKKDWIFHGHDVVGAKITAKIMARMLYPKKTIETVTKLVRWHMFFSDTEKITLSSVRRLVSNVGHEIIWDLMDVRACDRIGTGRPKESPYRLRKYKAMIEEVMHDPVTVGMLNIDGSRIMEVTREKPGPRIGFMLHALLEEVLEKPELNTKEYLENTAKNLSGLSEKELKEIGQKAKDKKEELEEKAIKEIRDKYWVQ